LSQVAVPFMGPVVAMDGSSEGMIVADIDLGILRTAEENYKVREDMSGASWHYA
jgi:hypothetical protein